MELLDGWLSSFDDIVLAMLKSAVAYIITKLGWLHKSSMARGVFIYADHYWSFHEVPKALVQPPWDSFLFLLSDFFIALNSVYVIACAWGQNTLL